MTMKPVKPTIKEIDTVVNYMVIGLAYNMSVCLPYADGVAFLAAMEKAECVNTYYSHEKLQFNNIAIEINYKIVTQKEYREQKMNQLLGIDLEHQANE